MCLFATSMVGVNSGIFIVIPLVWCAVTPIVRSPLLPQYILEENISYVPMNQEEYMNITKSKICEVPDHILTFALHPVSKRTVLGCFYEKIIIGKYCLEFNIDERGNIFLQQKHTAPCGELDITPCGFAYSSSESYKLVGCFTEYGGIPSLMQQDQKIEDLKQKELTSREFLEQKIEDLKEKELTSRKFLEQKIEDLKEKELTSRKSLEQKIEDLKQLMESLNRTVKEKDEKIRDQKIAIYFVVACIIIIILAIVYVLYHYLKLKTSKNIAISSGAQAEEGRSNECDPLNGDSENIEAPPKTRKNIAISSGAQAEEGRSNESDPLNGDFENFEAPPKTRKNIAISSGDLSEEGRSNESDPLNGDFQYLEYFEARPLDNITPDVEQVELEGEYIEDPPSTSEC